ncbi:CLIP-associating protein 2 [Cichlidogyrus casuarinus]|uniref:CLIP-associating protein 2 n=1 Tax=Cichlidogyrus casuarinus TaxID=1844966 RepID=A0ABD2QA29_9PLAT
MFSYMSMKLKNRFDHFAEAILPKMITLLSNSAKVMSTSGVVSMRYVLRNTCNPRLLPHLSDASKSKAAVTRRFSCHFLEIVLQTWPINALDKHSSLLKEMVKNGISDPDSEARSTSRRCFALFRDHFPMLAEAILTTMDASKRRMIEQELSSSSGTGTRSNSQSNISVSGIARRPDRPTMGTSGLNSTRKISAGARPDTASASTRMVTQSQPTSREVSPTRSIGGYSVTSKAPAARNGALERRRSQIGRAINSGVTRSTYSTQVSREPSPARSYVQSSTSQFARKSSAGSATGYSFRNRRELQLFLLHLASSLASISSDADSDEASETSSMCSERSNRSRIGYRSQHQVEYTDNVEKIIAQMNADKWNDRNSGLVNLQRFMKDGKALTTSEIQKIVRSFAKLFLEKHTKNVIPFMETLQLFIRGYNELIHDWLYTLLTKLLLRQGCETSGSLQVSIQSTLLEVRNNFPLGLQFSTCCRFITDKAQSPTLKVKAYMLEYLKDVVSMMSAPDLLENRNEDAVSKIITWSQEPKSNEVRRMAGRVILKLHDLHSAAFLQMLDKMPSPTAEQARKLLKTYEKTSHTTGPYSDAARRQSTASVTNSRNSAVTTPIHKRKQSCPTDIHSAGRPSFGFSGSSIPSPRYSVANQNADRTLQPETPENNGAHEANNNKIEPDNVVQQVLEELSNHNDSCDSEDTSQQLSRHDFPEEELIEENEFEALEASMAAEVEQEDDTLYLLCLEILDVHTLEDVEAASGPYEQRKVCMLLLIKMFHESAISTWDEHFKPILLILLETLGDDGAETRALALRVLQDLISHQPERFLEFLHLTIMKVLESVRDDDLVVAKAARLCAQELANHMPPEKCLAALIPMVAEINRPSALPALMMQTRVIANCPPELILAFLDQLKPGLIAACNHESSQVRKESIFCLVEVSLRLNQDIRPYLPELASPKVSVLLR